MSIVQPEYDEESFIKFLALRSMFNKVFSATGDVLFFDDQGSFNAFAYPLQFGNSQQKDGTVLMGRSIVDPVDFGDSKRSARLIVVIAHEYGHLYQFKHGISGPTLLMELHADAMAGWLAGIDHSTPSGNGFDYSVARRFLENASDTKFGVRDAHGTGSQRRQAFDAGFALGRDQSDIDDAARDALRAVREIARASDE
jgi:hypothetical protein